jgi:hypothetical protein
VLGGGVWCVGARRGEERRGEERSEIDEGRKGAPSIVLNICLVQLLHSFAVFVEHQDENKSAFLI